MSVKMMAIRGFGGEGGYISQGSIYYVWVQPEDGGWTFCANIIPSFSGMTELTPGQAEWCFGMEAIREQFKSFYDSPPLGLKRLGKKDEEDIL